MNTRPGHRKLDRSRWSRLFNIMSEVKWWKLTSESLSLDNGHYGRLPQSGETQAEHVSVKQWSSLTLE